MSQAWKNRIWNGSILAAFVAAMAVFVFLLQTEKRVLTEYEKEQVCVVTAAIPRGEKISAENAEQYITVMEIDKRIVPETALKSTEAASGRIAAYGVEQGMVLTTGMLRELSEITEQMREPVIAGFRAEDLYQVVGGVLRAGDRIHIYCVEQEEEEQNGKLLWENVFVQQVFDRNGAAIGGDDGTTPAQRVNIYMEKEQVCVVTAAIPRGEKISAENAEQYITVMEIDKRIVPETALKSTEAASGRIAAYGVEQGMVLTTGMLRELSEITEQMREPVIAGFRAEDLYQVVGGVLRAGDRIHIYCVEQEEEEQNGKLLWENVFVQQVFDRNGAAIGGDDGTTPAQRVNIYMEKERVADFYAALAQGSLRVVKAEDTDRQEE